AWGRLAHSNVDPLVGIRAPRQAGAELCPFDLRHPGPRLRVVLRIDQQGEPGCGTGRWFEGQRDLAPQPGLDVAGEREAGLSGQQIEALLDGLPQVPPL